MNQIQKIQDYLIKNGWEFVKYTVQGSKRSSVGYYKGKHHIPFHQVLHEHHEVYFELMLEEKTTMENIMKKLRVTSFHGESNG